MHQLTWFSAAILQGRCSSLYFAKMDTEAEGGLITCPAPFLSRWSVVKMELNTRAYALRTELLGWVEEFQKAEWPQGFSFLSPLCLFATLSPPLPVPSDPRAQLSQDVFPLWNMQACRPILTLHPCTFCIIRGRRWSSVARWTEESASRIASFPPHPRGPVWGPRNPVPPSLLSGLTRAASEPHWANKVLPEGGLKECWFWACICNSYIVLGRWWCARFTS